MADHQIRIVTPEAVELEISSAGLASRVMAAVIDAACMSMAFFAMATMLSLGVSISGSSTFAIVVLYVFLFSMLVIWPMAWELGTKGRSPGKLALGLRVVTIEGAPIRFRHAMIRAVAGVLEIFMTFGLLALFTACASPRFRRLGDHLAGTVVIRTRTSLSNRVVPTRFIPPPSWIPWERQLDTSRLTADDYRLVRSYLMRSPSLPRSIRQSLGTRILDRIGPRLGMTTPAVLELTRQYGPEAPLTAVAASYQNRFSRPAPVGW